MLPTKDGVSPSCMALPQGPWATLLDFLAERTPAVSRDTWQDRMQAGEVINAQGQPVPPDAPYQAHTKLYYWRHQPFEHVVPFEESIVFQDDHLLVADKPHFLPITPTGRHVQQTLLVRLKKRLGIDTLVPMHRIDRETAGLVAFTLRPSERSAYQNLFRDRAVRKVYEAVAPLLSHTRPELSLPLLYRSRLVESEHFMVMQEVSGEPNAETLIELIASHHCQRPHPHPHPHPNQQAPLGLYRLSPITGRKHQLRAQLNALGMPIVNDQIYPTLMPEPPLGEPPNFSQPLQLLARSLHFTDPITGVERSFHSQMLLDWPPDGQGAQAHGPIAAGLPLSADDFVISRDLTGDAAATLTLG